MANKRYYWLKLQNDFFDSKRIKKLRKLGADYVIIYLKMQLLAVKSDGVLEYTGLENTFADELALDIDEDSDKVQLTLSYLQSCGLLECNEDLYFLPYVLKNTGSETASTQRSRESRARKMLQCNTDATQVQQLCNVEKEIEKEIDIDNIVSKDTICRTDVQRVVEKWNELEQFGVKKISKLSPESKRYKSLVARIKQYGIDDVLNAITLVSQSNFLCGKETSWIITFDWFVLPNNFPKVLEGNYTDRKDDFSDLYDGAENDFEDIFNRYPNKGNYNVAKKYWCNKVRNTDCPQAMAKAIYGALQRFFQDYMDKNGNDYKYIKTLDRFFREDLDYWLRGGENG